MRHGCIGVSYSNVDILHIGGHFGMWHFSTLEGVAMWENATLQYHQRTGCNSKFNGGM